MSDYQIDYCKRLMKSAVLPDGRLVSDMIGTHEPGSIDAEAALRYTLKGDVSAVSQCLNEALTRYAEAHGLNVTSVVCDMIMRQLDEVVMADLMSLIEPTTIH